MYSFSFALLDLYYYFTKRSCLSILLSCPNVCQTQFNVHFYYCQKIIQIVIHDNFQYSLYKLHFDFFFCNFQELYLINKGSAFTTENNIPLDIWIHKIAKYVYLYILCEFSSSRIPSSLFFLKILIISFLTYKYVVF